LKHCLHFISCKNSEALVATKGNQICYQKFVVFVTEKKVILKRIEILIVTWSVQDHIDHYDRSHEIKIINVLNIEMYISLILVKLFRRTKILQILPNKEYSFVEFCVIKHVQIFAGRIIINGKY